MREITKNVFKFLTIFIDSMLERPYRYNIENVVATASAGSRLDLRKIAQYHRGLRYRPEIFPGLPFRLIAPRSTTLIFNSGKMVCTGTKSEEGAKKAIRRIIRELENIERRKFRVREVTIQNIVASGDFYGIIDLEKAHYNLPPRYGRMYEPEQFPGLIARDTEEYLPKGRGPLEKGSVFLLFTSAKFVSTGCKYEKSLASRVKDMYETLFDIGCLEQRT